MSIIPAFELGLWNAWIFMLLCLLPVPLVALFHKGVFKKQILFMLLFLLGRRIRFLFFKGSYVLPLYLLYFSTITIRDDMVLHRSAYLFIGINFAHGCLGECCYQPS